MLIKTSEITPSHPNLDQIYNAMDCCVTFEVFNALRSNNSATLMYQFERALQAPAFDMMTRGFLVDEFERQKNIAYLRSEIERASNQLDEMAIVLWGKGFNPASPKQFIALFYNHLDLQKVFISKKGERKLSTEREAVEQLESIYKRYRPLLLLTLYIRDLSKQLSTILTEVDPDGRMRTSINIAGTETSRFSSSKSSTGTGGNLQNWAPRLRRMMIADDGWKLCGIDLEQAESREVGWLHGTLFSDWRYLDACEGGDLHTTTSKLIWPQFDWTGNSKDDRKVAEQSFYRDFSYRDMAKRGGHGTSYYGTAFTMARHLKVPIKLIQNFQDEFFNAYPAMQLWHRYTAQELQRNQCITNAFGFTRHFFSRPNDDSTLREAIAFSPQSATAMRMNLGLWRIWKHLPEVRLLLQVHDAVYFLYRHSEEQTVIPKALKLIEVELSHNGTPIAGSRYPTSPPRSFIIPGEAKIGWNWANTDPKKKIFSDGNPYGLDKFVLGTPDARKLPDQINRIL